MKKLLIPLFLLFLSTSAVGSVDGAWRALVQNRGGVSGYPEVIRNLIESRLYFTSIAYLKEYLYSTDGRVNKDIDQLIDEVITQVGVRQFEVMPISTLRKASSPVIRYILAKKLFRVGKYQEALNALNGTIPREHPVKPFALFLEGSIFSLLGNMSNSVAAYKNCITETKKQMNRTDDPNRLRQLSINRDYCIVGIPRAQFADKGYDDASLTYLDLPKESYVWPEILFEEAWNSFYLRDYNRALGKLVTYKAPLMKFVFNPEIEVLKALTYMELCLFGDAKKVVDEFYKTYQEDTLGVKKFLSKYGKDYKYFYLLAKSKKAEKSSGNELLNRLLENVLRDAAFIELTDSFNVGREEIGFLKKLGNSKMRTVFTQNLRDGLLLQRDLIGAYVRKNLHLNMDLLDKSFEGMTYIKLEVLGRRKEQLYYANNDLNRSRGDIRYLQRNDKQYFWTFNGEFWADELGDYVFSLRSECGQ